MPCDATRERECDLFGSSGAHCATARSLSLSSPVIFDQRKSEKIEAF